VSARSLVSGSLGNVASPGMLVSHSFTSYTSHFSRALRVTNINPILNGRDKEQDASLKYRLSQTITAAEAANNTAVARAVLEVPGVADYVVRPFEDGVGRFNVYIKSIASTVSDKIIEDVQAALDDIKAEGVVGYARKPFEIGIEISSRPIYSQEYNARDKAVIINNLTYAAMSYINSLDIGQPLALADLARELRSVDPRIITVGSNRLTIFDAVYVWYPTRLSTGGRRREMLIQNSVASAPNARIIIEPSIGTPIQFT